MGCVPAAAGGFSPLDEELQLLPGQLSPWLAECLVRLSAWVPFEKATELLAAFTGVGVSEFTARQKSEAAGEAYVALQTEAVERLEREAVGAPKGPARQLVSADGAYVPLVGGEWAEVKTVVIGAVAAPEWEAKEQEWVVQTHQLSYFSRLGAANSFARLSLVETQRRGLAGAAAVCAVQDGAEWLQGFIDYHRPDAVRILDFPHAAGYVSKIGQAEFGADPLQLEAWLKTQLHQLKHRGPAEVLAELEGIVARHPSAAALELPEALAYLDKRRAQMQYPSFQRQGFPIGSGSVESGNKVVVEARLKGAGMHWARQNVNPMLALRNIVCNDRWTEAWPMIESRLRQQARARCSARHRICSTAPVMGPVGETSLSGAEVMPTPAEDLPPPGAGEELVVPTRVVRPPHRPAPDHPWRRASIGKANRPKAITQTAGKS